MFDLYPKYYWSGLIALSPLVIGICILFVGAGYGIDILAYTGIMLAMAIFPFTIGFFVIKVKYRFRLYQYGIIIKALSSKNDPRMEDSSNRWGLGDIPVQYEHIESLQPFAFIGRNKYFSTMGLFLILPKENNKFVSAEIWVSGKDIEKMPEVISILKAKMGPLWEKKYKRGDPYLYRGTNPEEIALLVEMGGNF